MNNENQLPAADFADIIRHAPLISIDLIVRNHQDQVLLGKRRNAPAKGFWFVPGGRIYKGEQLATALKRILLEELGVDSSPQIPSYLGVYDHIYEDNVFDDPSFGTHYIVLAHQLELEILPETLPTEEHLTYQWWEIEQLKKSPEVHPYTQAYFR
jgi:colanic acid biosynthesis protein WcaH